MSIDAGFLRFYGLQDRPFDLTPDPRFLHLTRSHREALAQLLYGVQAQKGFVLLTGEVGTGKTTLVRAFLARLGGNTAVAFVPNSMLPFAGLLQHVLAELGLATAGQSDAQRLLSFQGLLAERARAGQNMLLILDEAQHLDVQTLEQIRLLSNFETPTEKLLQVILVGQPELRARLALPELRQLKQRISLRCSTAPLSPEETQDYIRTRLRIARAPDLALFTERAMARIAEYSAGVPRVVNTVCDHCLVNGYADQIRRIDRDTVEETIEYLEEGARPHRYGQGPYSKRRMIPLRWGLVAVGAAALAATVGATLWPCALAQPLQVSASLPDLARSARGLVGL
jgi:general secretion pathway protein A